MWISVFAFYRPVSHEIKKNIFNYFNQLTFSVEMEFDGA